MRDRQYPLYHEELEHDSCGVGAVVDLNAKRGRRGGPERESDPPDGGPGAVHC